MGGLTTLVPIACPKQIVDPTNSVRVQPFYHSSVIEDIADLEWCLKSRRLFC